jgi:hypothetical protein
MYLLRYIDACLNSTPYVKPKDIIETGRSIIILIVTLQIYYMLAQLYSCKEAVDRDRMIVGFITTYAFSAFHH